MRSSVSQVLMTLAVRSLGESRREWALAMRVEFVAARAEGEGLRFALGCLIAAWGEMPKHAEGRHVLANYAIAIGLLIPMAALLFALTVGFSSALMGERNGVLLAGATQNPVLASSQISAVPCLLILWLLLGLGHLRLAWVLVERDWSRVIQTAALIGASIVTLFIVTGVLMLDLTFVSLQAAATAAELTAIVGAARWHARLFPNFVVEMPAG